MLTLCGIVNGSFWIVSQSISVGIPDYELKIGIIHVEFCISSCKFGAKGRLSGVECVYRNRGGKALVNVVGFDPGQFPGAA